MSFANDNCQPGGINDGIEPKSSGDQPTALCHWWPHKGTDEWVQYTWSEVVTDQVERREADGKEVRAGPSSEFQLIDGRLSQAAQVPVRVGTALPCVVEIVVRLAGVPIQLMREGGRPERGGLSARPASS
jgi:hypothetical protein